MYKKFVSFFGLLFIAAYCFGQPALITGSISDSKTNEPLPLATVFINNTTISTASLVSGQYTLRNIPAGLVEVVVSYVGYESSRTRITVHDGDRLLLNIRMIPSTVELPNVQVKGERGKEDKEWEKQYRKFEKVFLGENSTGAKIINPGIIDFKEEDKGNILKASATQPIEIENPGLGYHIFYYLRKYQSDKQSYAIVGDMRFEQLKETDSTKLKQWIRNRKEIYSGSLRHLLVSLIRGKASQEGFQLYVDLPGFNANVRSPFFSMNKGVVPFKADSIVFPGKKEGEFKIQFTKRVEVHYANKIAKVKIYKDIPCPVGWIDPTRGFVEVNAQGIVVNLADIVTSGYLSEARIASLLPNDYKP